jgi:hypothetical protein
LQIRDQFHHRSDNKRYNQKLNKSVQTQTMPSDNFQTPSNPPCGTSIPETGIRALIGAAWERMSLPQRQLWQAIRIDPVKWRQRHAGWEGQAFWVVGIFGRRAIWYNDIEEGFNLSDWSTHGHLDEYWCNQHQLDWTVQNLMNEITGGISSGDPVELSGSRPDEKGA